MLIVLVILRSNERAVGSLAPVILQSDNGAAILAANYLRTQNTALSQLAHKLVLVMEKYDMESFAFAHIPGEENKIADALSRGDEHAAVQEAKTIFGADDVVVKAPTREMREIILFMDEVTKATRKRSGTTNSS